MADKQHSGHEHEAADDADGAFGRWVKQRRKALDLTQAELADSAGCALITLKSIEGGSRRPSRQMVERLAVALQVPAADRERFLQLGRRIGEVGLQEVPAQGEPAIDGTNPYKGLHPFQPADALDFYGREAQTRALLGRLGVSGPQARFVAVVGPSGSGKSSLVRAGLIPALRAGILPGGNTWAMTDMTPGEEPLESLVAALLRVAELSVHDIRSELLSDERGLLRAADRVLAASQETELLLVIDQFEEIFTSERDDDARAHLLANLIAAAVAPESRVRVVVTLRADFFDRPLSYPEIGDLFQSGLFLIAPLTPDELERAIVAPAARRQVAVEPGLTATLIHAVADQPGLLPLLQYTLTELFAQRAGGPLTLAAYHKLGGVAGTLARSANKLYDALDALDAQSSAATRQLFLQLVSLGDHENDTRRRVARQELEARIGPSVGSILEHFGHHQLLTFDRDPRDSTPTVEIAHEALLVAWPLLRSWIDSARDDLRVQRHLRQAAETWSREGRDPALLAGGAWLVRYETLDAAGIVTLGLEERAFLHASLDERDRHSAEVRARQERELRLANTAAVAQRRAATRLLLLAVVLTASLVVATTLALLASNERASALANSRRSEALRLAAESVALAERGGSAELAALLSIRSLATDPTPQGQAALDLATTLPLPIAILGEHDDLIIALAASPDGAYVYTASLDHSLRRWDLRAPGSFETMELGTRPSALAISPDGGLLLIGFSDGTLEVRRWGEQAPLHASVEHAGEVTSIAVALDGRSFLTGGSEGTAILWDIERGTRLTTLVQQDTAVRAVAITPDGAMALVSGEAGQVTIWDLRSAQLLRVLSGHTGAVNSLAVDQNRFIALTGGADGTARLWDLSSGDELLQVQGNSGGVNAVAFLDDGAGFATAGEDRLVALWDTTNGRQNARLSASTVPVMSLAVLPDGGLVSTSGSSARLWQIRRLAVAPTLLGHVGAVTALALSPKDAVVASGGADGSVRLWDIVAGVELQRFVSHGGAVRAIVFTPDGSTLLSAGTDGQVIAWEVATGEKRWTGQMDSSVGLLSLSTDGRLLVTVDDDGSLVIWDVAQGQERRRETGHIGMLAAVISADGRLRSVTGTRLAVSEQRLDHPGTVRNFPFDEPSRLIGDQQSGLYYQGMNYALAAALSLDGEQIMIGQGQGDIYGWDVTTGNIRHELRGHIGNIRDLVIRGTGEKQVLISSGDDQTARVWDLASGSEQRLLSGHSAPVLATDLSSAGDLVLTASADGSIRQWQRSPQQARALLCHNLQRDLTESERLRYNIDAVAPTCSEPSQVIP